MNIIKKIGYQIFLNNKGDMQYDIYKIYEYQSFLIYYIFEFDIHEEIILQQLLELDIVIKSAITITTKPESQTHIGQYYYPCIEKSQSQYNLTYNYLKYSQSYDLLVIEFLLKKFEKKQYIRLQSITDNVLNSVTSLVTSDNITTYDTINTNDNLYIYTYLENTTEFINDAEIIKLFLINPDENVDNITLLYMYIYYRSNNCDIELVKLFITMTSENLILKNQNGQTPLHLYLQNCTVPNIEIIRLLIKDNLHKISQDNDGQTALHLYLHNFN
jgi:hypothetical protein